MKKLTVILGFVFAFMLAAGDTYTQCAMCRGTVESSMGNGRNNVGVGLNTGIMYLFVMPYLLVIAIGYFWYRNSKKERDEREFVNSRIKRAFQ